jgi:hypothetical protein
LNQWSAQATSAMLDQHVAAADVRELVDEDQAVTRRISRNLASGPWVR